MDFIGIDLGTTYSAISTIDQYGKPVVLADSYGDRLVPSAVWFSPDGEVKTGADAKDMLQFGEDVALFFKRYMGHADYSYTAAGKEYSATDLSSLLLSHLKGRAEAILGHPVSNAVITVPAYFNDFQRTSTIEAGRRVGLDVLAILNEPTAAAITYGINRREGGRILVYDLGGGTFDVTVLQIDHGELKVIATGGDHELGGKDFDDMLIKHIARKFMADTGYDIEDDMEGLADLTLAVENLKKQLSDRNSAVISVRSNGERQKYTVTRAEFEELTKTLLHATQSICNNILKEAGLGWQDLDGALLVGGSTRMPMVYEWVAEMTGKRPLTGVNADEAVALGAAIVASMKTRRILGAVGSGAPEDPRLQLADSVTVSDVMSHSLGTVAVSSDGTKYVNSIIIRKNKEIPVTNRRQLKFRTRQGGKNLQTVYLTQGESPDIDKCLVVGKYLFHGIEHINNPEGAVIEIGYSYDANGVVSVEGLQVDSGKKLTVEKVALDDDLSWLYEAPRNTFEPMSVVLTIDESGSMCWRDAIKKACKAAEGFIEQLPEGSFSITVQGFADSYKNYCTFEKDASKAKRELRNIEKDTNTARVGYGNACEPIRECHRLLMEAPSENRILVILTDGEWSRKNQAIEAADRAKADGIRIAAIGFGSADKKFLRKISSDDSLGIFTSADNLSAAFSTIAREFSTGLKR
ncbi:MAG: Hsp70 family protein [Muribaculaceae bacterium]|nr:Hsp70 family protein [Muribaculaceae bacterium]